MVIIIKMLNLSITITVLFFVFVILTIYLGIKVVPQSKVFIVERFGKYHKTLNAGLSIIVPYLDKVEHKVLILERQLEEFRISVITVERRGSYGPFYLDRASFWLISWSFWSTVDASIRQRLHIVS